jgi:hypothetical protein
MGEEPVPRWERLLRVIFGPKEVKLEPEPPEYKAGVRNTRFCDPIVEKYGYFSISPVRKCDVVYGL